MEKFYICEEIAERYKVSVDVVWRWCREKKLPAIKIGSMYRISAEDLKAFELANRTIPKEKKG